MRLKINWPLIGAPGVFWLFEERQVKQRVRLSSSRVTDPDTPDRRGCFGEMEIYHVERRLVRWCAQRTYGRTTSKATTMMERSIDGNGIVSLLKGYP